MGCYKDNENDDSDYTYQYQLSNESIICMSDELIVHELVSLVMIMSS